MTHRYTLHSDPAHGWLEVTIAELAALGIADRISGYSYQSRDGLTAYLEEDGDLTRFALAKGINSVLLKDWTEGVQFNYCDYDSPIRALPRYGRKK
jgi:hypothetical protein